MTRLVRRTTRSASSRLPLGRGLVALN